MSKKFDISRSIVLLSVLLLAIGITAGIIGVVNDPARTWGNVLICNYYFISLAIGASFFAAIQNISQSGWSAMFKRVPEAIVAYLPYGALLILLMILAGARYIYPWLDTEAVRNDELMQHKSPYLNFTFFLIRAVVFLLAWIFLTTKLRKFSVGEDRTGGLTNFNKSEFYSKVYIFVLAITFSLATFDWIMSIDTNWFSTIFALKNFVSAFLHGSAVIVLIVLILYKKGYFPDMNIYHRHDFSKYLFMLSIMWGYLWFSQYFLIWFANLSEETVYFSTRTGSEWHNIFFADISINWLFPFLFLMLNRIAKNIYALMIAATVLLAGLWIDIYLQVMPGLTGVNAFGLLEIGIFAGFLGVFILAVSRALGRAAIIPQNHPYLKESNQHKLH